MASEILKQWEGVGMRLAWPEKTALLVFVIVTAGLLFLSAMAGAHVAGAVDAFMSMIGYLALWYLLPFWIALRVIDLVLGGPQRRRGRVTAYLR